MTSVPAGSASNLGQNEELVVKLPSTFTWKYLQYHPPHRMCSVVIGKLRFSDVFGQNKTRLKVSGFKLHDCFLVQNVGSSQCP